jgi:Flp pilus assembly pilin Flp
MSQCWRLMTDDAGQDTIEYALLAAFIGVAGAVIWPVIATGIGTAYGNFDSRTQNAWVPPDPAAGS